MTQKLASGGAVWTEPADTSAAATAGIGVVVDDPASPGDYTIAATGAPAAEFVDDPASPGDYTLAAIGATASGVTRGVLFVVGGDYFLN